jgi:hypothetical protein
MLATLFVDVVGVVLAFAAFVIAVAALYLTALRRADIEVDHIPTASRVAGNSPAEVLHLGLFMSNSGVRGGVLESVRMDGFVDSCPALWTALEHTATRANGVPLVRRVLTAGDGIELELLAT